ncbi:MAG TPA: TetR/AcrR family transcriptional regulator [Polyangiaceae bacterium]|nr:TetR/AcrR family transcriptional regulator [Polyangiaceae bacterium]
MLAKPAPRKRLPAAERKLQIAEATLQILARQGVRELTAQSIARAVGIQDGSLFRHFDSIEAMVAAAIDLFEARMAESFPTEGPEPLDQLRRFFLHRANLVSAHPDVMRLAFNDRLIEVAGNEGTLKVQQMVTRSLAFVRTCLDEAQRKQMVRKDVPAEVLVWTVVGVLRGSSGATASLPAKRPPMKPAQAWRAVEALLVATPSVGKAAPARKRKQK